METHTREIPRESWARFLRQVESLHRDKPVEVELVGRQLGAQILAEGAQLRGISFEEGRQGRRLGKRKPSIIELDLGLREGVDHRVFHAERLYAIQRPSGELECLDIEDDQQTKTLVRFKEWLALPGGPAGAVDTEVVPALVRDFMSSPAKVLPIGSTLADAHELMRQADIRHLPVIDADRRPVGLLSHRNLWLVRRERGIPPEDILVDELMSTHPFTVAATARLDEAAAVMAQRKYGCAIVTEGEQVIGILTTTDALRALVQLQARGGATLH